MTTCWYSASKGRAYTVKCGGSEQVFFWIWITDAKIPLYISIAILTMPLNN